MRKPTSISVIGIVCWCLFFSCQPSPTAKLKKNLEKCDVHAGLSYNQYLDSLIIWQEKLPIKKKKFITFSLNVYNVGRDSTSLPEEEINGMVQFLNESFESANIRFKLIGEQKNIKSELKVDDYFRNAALEDSLCVNNYDSKYVNLYIVEQAAEVMGYSHYPNRKNQRVFIHKNKIFDPALVHEFGHFFGLLHTFENTSGAEEIYGGNCRNAGDKICDTPADPVGASFIEDECKLYGQYQNGVGQDYSPEMHNFMSYYGRCRHSFSQQQQNRMFFVAKYVKSDIAMK